jgi:hypothetical protein
MLEDLELKRNFGQINKGIDEGLKIPILFFHKRKIRFNIFDLTLFLL